MFVAVYRAAFVKTELMIGDSSGISAYEIDAGSSMNYLINQVEVYEG